MRGCIDLLPRLERALADARTILEKIPSGERVQVLMEARAQGISAELLVAREICVMVSDAEIEALKRLNVTGARAVLPSDGGEIAPSSRASLYRSPGVSSPKDEYGSWADTRGIASEGAPPS
jgi:hypothetical protein